jgi:hypothetical protein
MDEIKEDEMYRTCSTHGRDEKGKKGKRPLRRPRRRWEDNIRMYLREISWKFSDWIQLAQDKNQWRALVNTVVNLMVP